MPSSSAERRLAAILSADAVGYSRLMAADELATLRAITGHRERIAALVTLHQGRVVDAPGDNLLAEFPAATAAVSCALDVQRAITEENESTPVERRMEFRIGLHVGEILSQDGKLYGDGINVAARLESIAEARGIVCSSALRDQVRSLRGVAFEDLGPQHLKNLADDVHAFRVHRPTERAPAEAPTTPAGTRTLAVLPFENTSGDPEQEYFADGVVADLITELSRIPQLHVIARTSVFTYKGRTVRADQIGKELGVRYLVEGSMRRAGDRVRINAQLVEAPTGRNLWAERYDRQLDDMFALQDEVTREIVSALEVELRPESTDRSPRKPTVSLEAYDLYLRAVSYSMRFERESVMRARALLEQAVQLDPGFASAWAELGNAYTIEHAFWAPGEDAIRHAEELIRKGVSLDPEDSVIRASLSRALWFQGRTEESLEEAQRSLELNPGSAEAFVMLAHALRANGRLEEAVAPSDRAVRLDPRNFNARFERGSLRYFLGEFGPAEDDLRSSIAESPDFLPAHLILAACLGAQSRDDEARAEVAEVLRIAPGYSVALMRQRVPLGHRGVAFEQDLIRLGLPEA